MTECYTPTAIESQTRLFHVISMSIEATYKRHRKVGTELTERIMAKSLSGETTKSAAKLMGILKGNQLVLESEEEGVAFLDFVLHDYRVDHKTIVQTFQEQVGGQTEEERNLLDSWLRSYTSLFKIKNVSSVENSVVLEDLLQPNQSFKLLDFSLSQSALPGLLIFTRLIPLQDVYITSGVIFGFVATKEAKLLKQYKYRSKKVKSEDEAIQRFIAFFNLNRTDGILVGYQ